VASAYLSNQINIDKAMRIATEQMGRL